MRSSRGSLPASALVLLIVGLVLGGYGGYLISSSYGIQGSYEVRGDIEDSNVEPTELHSLVSSLEEKNTEYESRISSLEAEKSDYEIQVSALETELDDANNTMAHYEVEICDLESVVFSLNQEKEGYETKILSLEADIIIAENALREYEDQASKLEAQILDLQSRNEILEEELTSCESKIGSLNSQLSSLESELSALRNKLASKNDEISSLNFRLSKILNIDVKQHYEWVYGSWLLSNRYEWELTIPLSLYLEYYERPRPGSWREWVEMAMDRGDDYYIDEMIRQINSAAISRGFTEIEKVNFVVAFVQSLPYTVDNVSTPWNEYPRFPIETLFDRGGDCEDTSILTAALFDKMGYDVCLLFLSYEKHVAVGIAIQETYGSYYKYNDKKYYYLETTGEGWRISDIPSSFTDTRAYIYPINP